MNPLDEKDDLWQLLGKLKEPKVSPFFARNVLREVRALQRPQPRFASWLQRRWLTGLLGAAALCVVSLLVTYQPAPAPDQLAAIAEEVADSPDYLVISDLDELLASEESSVWLENSVY